MEGRRKKGRMRRTQRYGLGFKESQYYWLEETPETEGHDERGLVQGCRA